MPNLMTAAFMKPEICSKVDICVSLHDILLQFNNNMNGIASKKLYTKFNDSSSHSSRDQQYYKDKQK